MIALLCCQLLIVQLSAVANYLLGQRLAISENRARRSFYAGRHPFVCFFPIGRYLVGAGRRKRKCSVKKCYWRGGMHRAGLPRRTRWARRGELEMKNEK